MTGEPSQNTPEKSGEPRVRRVLFPRPLIFIHIPKAAGTSLISAVITRYAMGRDFCFTGLPARTAAFKALPESQRAGFDILHGHVHFGIHRWLPEPATYMTMLRDPVERLLSHYYYVKRSPDHYLHDDLHARRISFKQYITQRITWETDNDMVRWLTEADHEQVPHGHVSRALLDEAMWNLQNAFAIFGIAERFDESLACIRAAFGWPDLACEVPKNVNPDRPREELPPDTLDAIRETNSWDLELYDFALALFEEQLGRLEVPPQPGAGLSDIDRDEAPTVVVPTPAPRAERKPEGARR